MNRKQAQRGVRAIAAVVCAIAASPASAATVTEIPMPTPDSYPAGFVVGPDGAVWFSGGEPRNGEGLSNGAPYVGRVDLRTLRVTQAPVGAPLLDLTARAGDTSLVGVPALVREPALTRFDTRTAAASELRPGGGTLIANLTASRDGRLFGVIVEDPSRLVVAQLDPGTGGRIREIAVNRRGDPGPNGDKGTGSFTEVEAGPDGSLWTVETLYGSVSTPPQTVVSRIDLASGETRRFELPAGQLVAPRGLEPDARGAWFGSYTPAAGLSGSAFLGRIDLGSGSPSLSPLTGQSVIDGFATAADGTVFFSYDSAVHRIAPGSGGVTRFDVPASGSLGGDLVVAPDGTIWTGQTREGNLVRVDPRSDAPPTVNAATTAAGGLQTPVTCTADCRGAVTVSATQRAARGAVARASRARTVRLGTKRFTGAKGRRFVTVRLSAAGKRLLRRSGTTRVTVSVRGRQGKRRLASSRRVNVRRYRTKLRAVGG